MFIMITDFGLSILAPQLPCLFIFIFYYWQVLSKTVVGDSNVLTSRARVQASPCVVQLPQVLTRPVLLLLSLGGLLSWGV